jgi:5-methyltetrahydropteroyltriglutamate--homocysteine methyltransferase
VSPLDSQTRAETCKLAVSTQCGFASVAAGNPITPEQQARKLELLAKVARDTWPKD